MGLNGRHLRLTSMSPRIRLPLSKYGAKIHRNCDISKHFTEFNIFVTNLSFLRSFLVQGLQF